MGSRRNRKRERRVSQRGRESGPALEDAPFTLDPFDRDDLFAAFSRHATADPPAPSNCGSCREFIEDPDAGRGTCLHPGSGILGPWSDTVSCQFFARRRHR